MRCFLICLCLALPPFFSGCETAFGGSESENINTIRSEQTQQVNEEEQSGQLTSQEATADINSIDARASQSEATMGQMTSSSANPAGETFQNTKD